MLAETIWPIGFFNALGGFSLDNNAAVYLMSHSKEKWELFFVNFRMEWVRLELTE